MAQTCTDSVNTSSLQAVGPAAETLVPSLLCLLVQGILDAEASLEPALNALGGCLSYLRSVLLDRCRLGTSELPFICMQDGDISQKAHGDALDAL